MTPAKPCAVASVVIVVSVRREAPVVVGVRREAFGCGFAALGSSWSSWREAPIVSPAT